MLSIVLLSVTSSSCPSCALSSARSTRTHVNKYTIRGGSLQYVPQLRVVITLHLTPYTKNGVSHYAFFHVLLSQRANVHTVNSQNTAQLIVKAPKISVVNSQTSQTAEQSFEPQSQL